jgi:hypothetical protein
LVVIAVNQTNGSNWLLSDAAVDFIHVYLQYSCSNDIPSVEKRLQELLHEEGSSSDAQNLVVCDPFSGTNYLNAPSKNTL